MSLNFTSIALSLVVNVPDESMEQHLAATPYVVTDELVSKILAYEHQHQLGYYPALDYYIQNNAFEADLIDAVQNISWVVTSMVRNQIKIKLRPAFSNIKFEAIQPLAYTMPTVRPTDPNKTDKLIEHFSLATVKLNLIATLIQKVVDKQAAQSFAGNLAHRWLKDSFTDVSITSATVIERKI